ncbi:hypothetical protein IE81DRAFT_367169 [Ceraceosorus guamensis]|uniref:Uncharacterized protein n=1 Tax=Ceraceosorus guamensis TaxID=1522189 RepID=A0A316VZV5_9BASI|nr:hypothetical protein IE81DRAFT_367169 [Ceraceosorus guamensis]PWN41821.1 hypothetical protein IE81DRAFT_367169 [Ceraceosorus guamensis]
MQSIPRQFQAVLSLVASSSRPVAAGAQRVCTSAAPIQRERAISTSAAASTSTLRPAQEDRSPLEDGRRDAQALAREEAKSRIRSVMRAGGRPASAIKAGGSDTKAAGRSSKRSKSDQPERALSPTVDPRTHLLNRKQIEKLVVTIRETLNSPKHANPWVIKGKRQQKDVDILDEDSRQRLLNNYKFHVRWKVEALGAYRRGANESQGVFLCYMEPVPDATSAEQRRLTSPGESEAFGKGQALQREKELAGVSKGPALAAQAMAMAFKWAEREIHTRARGVVRRDGQILFKVPQARIPMQVHIVDASSLGSARLLLTGNEHYSRFLQLMAEEGMGLRLDVHGLWHHAALSQRAREAKKGTTGGATLLTSDGHLTEAPLAALASVGSPSEEGQKADANDKAAYNASMGLPADLDLSLDLGGAQPVSPSAKSTRPAQAANVPSASHDGAITLPEQNIDLSDPGWKRLGIGASEAEVLDILGLAYLEPAQRNIKGPADESSPSESPA